MTDRKPKKTVAPKTKLRPAFKILLAAFIFLFIGTSAVALYYYQYYSAIINRRLSGEVFQNTARLYASPFHIYPGQKVTPDAIVARLQRAGLEPVGSEHGDQGSYSLTGNRLKINPTIGDELELDFQKNVLTKIVRTKTGDVGEATLPAELVTSLSDKDRQKRRIVEFKELPPVLVHALIAAEDNRFYSHWGIDPVRLAGAIFQSFRNSDRVRGTSTLTQQLSRNFFLTPQRSMTRKLHEAFISLMLEQRLSKEQILTLYANDVYLGARGSFQIKGFGEGAAAYFGKDLTAITLPEAALLAAIIPAPSGAASPTNHPEEAKRRRNVVLNSMAELKFITEKDAEAAKQSDIKLAPVRMDATDAPYLVDYIRESLLKDFSEDSLNNDSLRVYTTLDPDLQRAAVDAVKAGLADVTETLAKRNKNKKDVDKLPGPQAALIALDTRTGGIVAMVGGGDYGESQYNRITQANRQPGSIFKPFVTAAAFQLAEKLAADRGEASADAEPQEAPGPIITPITMVDDVATTFVYDGDRTYEPNNYHEQYNGPVTVRYALEHSLNVPTIKIGELIGFDRVASLAQLAGMNAKIKGYPSVALGAFEVTPIEMAGAYTIFPNAGKHLEPHALVRVVAPDGLAAKSYTYPEREVLSPQVAYLMTNLMEGVLARGTGVGVRSRGFTLPAAGKTGTSRDGWFAGFTKDFIVIAWVGFDDNRDLNLEGAHSALPIWTSFMKKAQELYPPRDLDAMYFSAPDGIESVSIDSMSHLPATPTCPETYTEVFLSGTVPTTLCPLHSPSISSVIQGGLSSTGKGIGKIFSSIGGFFGIGKSNRKESDTPAEPSTSSH